MWKMLMLMCAVTLCGGCRIWSENGQLFVKLPEGQPAPICEWEPVVEVCPEDHLIIRETDRGTYFACDALPVEYWEMEVERDLSGYLFDYYNDTYVTCTKGYASIIRVQGTCFCFSEADCKTVEPGCARINVVHR